MSEYYNSKIMSINRLIVNTEGEGITTLVAFWGCKLKCKYCINPQCSEEETYRVSASPRELIQFLSIDDIYFVSTGGGVVFGGGEPLLQDEYILEVCKLIPEKWQIRIETSLNVSWENIEKLIPYIDKWIVDIKDGNPAIYKKYTRIDGKKVYKNMLMLNEAVGKEKIEIRIPRIPEFNNEEDVAKSVEQYKDLGEIEVFDYIVNKGEWQIE